MTTDDHLRGFRGDLIRPPDPAYDRARALWNGDVDRRPALVARPLDADDVGRALNHAAALGLQVTVRGGGHHVAGWALADGAVVIDLCRMRSVVVDVDARRARVQGGATWADVDAATQPHGLVVPGGVVSQTGVGGLTLGGGMGWLRRSLGLSSDHVTALDLVLADGTTVRADADHEPDLFHALRGGGGGLGVVTAFEFGLSPLGPQVMFCAAVYSGDRAREVLHAYRDLAAGLPDEVTTSVLLGKAPDIDPYPAGVRGELVVTIAAMFAGDPARGEIVLGPLRELAGTAPALDLSGVMD